MMSIISGRYGTVVSYLRLMFWTPRPTGETSSEPNLRRPLMCVCTLGSATAGVESTPARTADAEAPVMPKKERRSMLIFMLLWLRFPMVVSLLPGFGGRPAASPTSPAVLRLGPNATGRPCRARQHPCKLRRSGVMGIDVFRSHLDAFCVLMLGILRYCWSRRVSDAQAFSGSGTSCRQAGGIGGICFCS